MKFRNFIRLLFCGISVAISLYFALLRNQEFESFTSIQYNYVELKIIAGPDRIFIATNNSVIVNGTRLNQRGIHVAILHQFLGFVMAYRKFDTFQILICNELLEFLSAVSAGRIIVIATKDEVSYCRN